ncbi:MAG: CoA transferase [Acidobacteriia bacterium]|nr:CoA transferase [Terriglobia bacterium]
MGPLNGIQVLDVASFLAGPVAAMQLGDMGAAVIKIEPPGGDLARAWSPFLNGESRYFLGWNRNKRGMVLDLTKPAAREVLYELVRRSDVLIENFRLGVTKRLGMDYETLRKINPRLIYASSNAFGARGPDAERPGYDPVLQCLSGVAQLNARHNGGTPAITSVAVSDFQAAMQIVTGVCAALYHRERTGEGQKIETSLLQAVMALQSHHFVEGLDCQEEGGLGIFPYQLFATSDTLLFVAAATDKFWRLLCEALGDAELACDARYATNGQRVVHADALRARLGPLFLRRSTAEWQRILIAAGVPCGAVQSHKEFFGDPQVMAMGQDLLVDHAGAGRLRMSGMTVDFEKTPGALQRAAPRLGEHTSEILEELGIAADPTK